MINITTFQQRYPGASIAFSLETGILSCQNPGQNLEGLIPEVSGAVNTSPSLPNMHDSGMGTRPKSMKARRRTKCVLIC
jgi:hypothetical protein